MQNAPLRFPMIPVGGMLGGEMRGRLISPAPTFGELYMSGQAQYEPGTTMHLFDLVGRSSRSIPRGLLVLAVACSSVPISKKAPLPSTEHTPLSATEVDKIIVGLNQIERFPVPLSVLEEVSGVTLGAHLEVGRFMHAQSRGLSLTMTGTENNPTGGDGSSGVDPLIETVKIERTGVDLVCPPHAPNAIRFDVGTYAYLPTHEWADRVGDARYRHLRCEARQRDDEAPIHSWTYEVNDERGPYIAASERQELQRVILGLLQAIREDRFVAQYEAFRREFPKTELGSHKLYGHTVTIMQFDDRDDKYKSDFLKKDGLTAYVGIHVYNEAGSDVRYPHPYLFDFFAIERLDAQRFFKGTPYNPVRNDISGRKHPLADLQTALPDISAAGQRHGGLAHYSNLEYRADGWTFECPGFYPHDGVTVAKILDPALLQFGGFTVTHSRPR